MDRNRYNIGAFQFADPNQKLLFEELSKLVGPGPSSYFRDACFLMENPQILLSTAHIVAHLLREIESSIRSLLAPVVDIAIEKQPGLDHTAKIKAIIHALGFKENGPEERAWLKLSGRLHSVAHRRGLEAPRPMDDVKELWENSLYLFKVLMVALRTNSQHWFAILDKLLEKPEPTRKDLRILTQELPINTVTRGYFFNRLNHPGWLEPLWKARFFSNPPGLTIEDETIKFPPWPEAKYLARMAKHKPDIVAKIIGEMPDTDNVYVQIDLTEALLSMPPAYSARLVGKVEQWAKSKYIIIWPEKLGQLIVHLAKGGKVDEAMKIAGVLLDILPDNRKQQVFGPDNRYRLPPHPRARFDTWHYEEILKEHYPELLSAAGLPALKLLCDLLEKAIKLSKLQDSDETTEDYSSIWHPTIEGHSQDIGKAISNILVIGVRDSAELLVRSRKATVKDVVSVLEERRYKVFHRIALHILRVFSDQAMELMADRLTNQSIFNNRTLWHEYALLMKECFGQLKPEEQTKLLRLIDTGHEVKMGRDAKYSKEDYERWQLERLAFIGFYNLPENWQKRYRVLVDRYGEPEHQDFRWPKEIRWVGPFSPKTSKELKAMSVEDIVNFLKTWSPHKNSFDTPSPEGLGRVLSSVVAEAPEVFASKAELFQGLDPTYVRAFVSGLQSSLKNDKIFNWEPVLKLCRWVLNQPREIEGRHVNLMEADPDWGWTRKAIADLLFTGFDDIQGSIPIRLREKSWDVLKPLTEDPNPTADEENQYGGTNIDLASFSINTTRGEAMHAVINYALWVRRYIEDQEDAKERLQAGFDEMPEVREVLNAHLDRTLEPSLAIRAIYGQWFPLLVLLDQTWARENASIIFPSDNRDESFFEAAWTTYIRFCVPYDNVFDILHEQYYHAIERIGYHQEDTSWLVEADRRLAEHLMVFYWRGKISLDEHLLKLFWGNASDELRGHALSFIGRMLEQTDEGIPKEILERLKKLWEDRFEKARNSPTNFVNELAVFGRWFVSGKFDTAWGIKQLSKSLQLAHKVEVANIVLEHLVKTVTDYPIESVECVKMIAESDKDGWAIYLSLESVRKVLEVALQNPTSRKETVRIINDLLSRGFLEFRDLLEG